MTASPNPEATIIAILEEQRRLYPRLLNVAEQKRTALLASDVEALAPLVCEMEGLCRAMTRLEQQRIEQVAALTGSDDPVTLSALAPRLSPEAGRQILPLKHELLESLQHLRTLNDGNAALVQQALIVADRCVRLLRNATAPAYAATGSVVEAQAIGRAWRA